MRVHQLGLRETAQAVRVVATAPPTPTASRTNTRASACRRPSALAETDVVVTRGQALANFAQAYRRHTPSPGAGRAGSRRGTRCIGTTSPVCVVRHRWENKHRRCRNEADAIAAIRSTALSSWTNPSSGRKRAADAAATSSAARHRRPSRGPMVRLDQHPAPRRARRDDLTALPSTWLPRGSLERPSDRARPSRRVSRDRRAVT